LVRAALDINRPLSILGAGMLLVLLATLVGAVVDPGVITGAPAWVKPAKFEISIYSFTFVRLLSFLEDCPRLSRWMANLVTISFMVEMTAILTQAARGTTSHFNITTPFNSYVWMTMGTFIVFVWVMTLLLAVLLIRQHLPDSAFAWSLRLGVLISVVGMSVAFLMVRPTPAQVVALTAAHGPRIIGAHSVGVPDGGPGLPFLGGALWRATCGPRISLGCTPCSSYLFFLGWLLARRPASFFLGERRRLALVWTVGLAYLGLVLLLVWQALRGQSVIHPDVKTLATTSALAIAAAFSILVAAHALRANRKCRRVAPRLIAGEVVPHPGDSIPQSPLGRISE
jgi:hypothetical protein